MRLIVDHRTLYRYETPVRAVVQSHRMTPADCDSQKVLDWTVTVSGGTPGGRFRDGAGDWIQGWSVSGPVDEIEVAVKGTVETRDTSGVLKGLREGIPPIAYMIDTLATEADTALVALANGAEASEPLALAHALSEAVAKAIQYTPGATDAATTAAEALALGKGVCQDHAQALIACARVRGLPARYVSGYLFSDAEGDPHEAAHAWTEIHIAGLGWVGFDPANECCPDDRYIRIGSGLDAFDAAPIRGMARGRAATIPEALEVKVAVLSEQSQSQSQ